MRYRFLRFPEGKFKAVTLSYDDGLRSDIRFAETVSKYGMKATFNVNYGFIEGAKGNGEGYLSAQEIKDNIIPLGHEIAIHGYNHRAVGILRPTEIVGEFYECRKSLEREFGGIIRGMAYPDFGIKYLTGGRSYEEIKGILASLGIAYSRNTLTDASFSLPTDWHDWRPTVHNTDSNVLELVDSFLAVDEKKLYVAYRHPKLFYMWGHTTEFNRNDGWELLDKICEKLGNREDVWYATNIEIYNYVKAYEALEFSLDGTVVYNPTVITVWFQVDGKMYSINPGETIEIK